MTSGSAMMSDGVPLAWQIDGADIDGTGDAPVLLLSNSLGTTRAMWDKQIASLSSQFRILRYDTRGHGRSDAPHGAYGLDRLGRDVVELLDTLEIAQAHFCGVSLGGMTGQWLGVHAPNRLDRLILANTAPFMGPPSSWQTRIETVLDQGMVAIADAVLERWFTPDFLAAKPKIIERLRRDMLACPPQGYAGCCAAIRDMDLRPTIGLIDRPTLVISGSRDPATPPSEGAAISAAIAGAQSMTLDAAHLSNIEQADQFNTAMLNFLS